MFGFVQCRLTEGGLLELEAGELSLGSAAAVNLVDETKSESTLQNGTLYITTHRIAWVHAATRTAVSGSLRVLAQAKSPVVDVSQKMPPKVRLLLRFGRGVRVELMKNGKAEKDRILEILIGALGKKKWEVPLPSTRPATAAPGPSSSGRPGSACGPPLRGVQDIVNFQRQKAHARGEQIIDGFKSLDSLMESADNLVQIAKRFRTLNADNHDENILLNMIADMGINSPVTKAATGNNVRLYRMDLAKQMSDFLTQVVVQSGGTITIIDAYYTYNRARLTTELVSPDDFDAALRLLGSPEVNSSLELVVLQSGVRAIQVDVSKESGGAKALASLAEARSCLTALDIVQDRGIPLQLAKKILESAESAGYLARDETTDGVRFFPNRFPSMVLHVKAVSL